MKRNLLPTSNLQSRIIIAVVVTLLVIVLALLSSYSVQGAPPSQGNLTPVPTPRALPPDNPRRGMIHAGLEVGGNGTCSGLFKITNTTHCSHGPDPASESQNITQSVAPLDPAQLTAPNIQCIDDGSSGNRYQVMYVRAANVTSRYSQYLASFQQWASDADQIYMDSAAETSGVRHLRYVHDASCTLSIPEVVTATGSDATFSATITAVKAQGYNRTDRKYMMFVDATVYCGIGSLFSDDRKVATNSNNSGPSYARADAGCWSGSVQAHESMHNLGGVQLSAPHTSAGYHCVDEWDRMCYSDSPNYPAMQTLCSDSAHNRLFDCNHDDYFHTNPPAGNYLASFWNPADNQFLINTGTNTVGCSSATSPISNAPRLRTPEADQPANNASGRNATPEIRATNPISIFLPLVIRC